MRASLGQELAQRAEEFLEHLLGAPTQRHPREWRYGRRGSLSCTVRGEKRGLYFDHEAGEGGDLVQLAARVRGLSLSEAARAARAWLGPTRGETLCAAAPVKRSNEPRRSDGMLELAMGIWRECVPARGTLVETYLKWRGFYLPETDEIRFHPRLWYSPTRRRLPAMVALMRDIKTSAPTGVHRTYLRHDGLGKAPVPPDEPEKMTIGRCRGACIKLAPDDDVTYGLGIAEGIETAIAMLSQAPPMWVALSAGGVRCFPVLAGIEALTIYADPGQAGLTAAQACAKRWRASGCEVTLSMPGAHEDWADVAKAHVQRRKRS